MKIKRKTFASLSVKNKKPIAAASVTDRTENKPAPVSSQGGLMIDVRTNKECPKCRVSLKGAVIANVEVDYCPKCLGLWFDEDELRWAKDQKDKNLQWLDIDLWKDDKKFRVAYGVRLCPSCRLPLYEVYYGDSKIVVDVCRICRGIWLDRAEFKKIIDWLRMRADYEILNKYAKNFFSELAEIFTGPESLREEIADFLAVLKLLNYKLVVKNPLIAQLISQMPK